MLHTKKQTGLLTTAITHRGRVVSNFGAELIMLDEDGQYHTATPLKKLGLLVCGDIITCEISSDGNRVTEVADRSSTLARTDRRGQAKAIAANVTQLIAVTAPMPPFDSMLIDRYGVAARHINVDLAIVINKTDLLDKTTSVTADSIEEIYTNIGYPVTRCSKNNADIANLNSLLANNVSILVGQSGVGKSSLLNRLLPDEEIKVGALSELSGLGRHTTTVTTWFDLPGGGAIIDSAGVRQFALDHLSDVDLQAGFREISHLSTGCKFNDCKHIHEPHCAVLEALETNRLAQQRYDHFQSMRED